MSTPTASPSSPSVLDTFKDILEKGIQSRGANYSKIHAVSLRFESDDTRAFDDSSSFITVFRDVIGATTKEIVISITDGSPEWTLYSEMILLLGQLSLSPDRELLVFHYAGHGQKCKVTNDLLFTSYSQRIRWGAVSVLHRLLLPEGEARLGNKDIVYLLDCCYSDLAVYRSGATRTVELLAACKDTGRTFSRTAGITLTQKVASIIRNEARHGQQKRISFSQILEIIITQKPANVPHFEILLSGPTPIVLPLLDPNSLAPIRTLHEKTTISAVFTLHLPDDPRHPAVTACVQWLQKLPSNIPLSLVRVYPTSSTMLIIESSVAIWAEMSVRWIGQVHLLCFATRANEIQGILAERCLNREFQQALRICEE